MNQEDRPSARAEQAEGRFSSFKNMKLGRICGTVVATVKDSSLAGLRLRLMQPARGDGQWAAKPIVAVDTVGSREGDVVIWISAREATLAVTDRVVSTDAAIVGIVDE